MPLSLHHTQADTHTYTTHTHTHAHTHTYTHTHQPKGEVRANLGRQDMVTPLGQWHFRVACRLGPHREVKPTLADACLERGGGGVFNTPFWLTGGGPIPSSNTFRTQPCFFFYLPSPASEIVGSCSALQGPSDWTHTQSHGEGALTLISRSTLASVAR